MRKTLRVILTIMVLVAIVFGGYLLWCEAGRGANTVIFLWRFR